MRIKGGLVWYQSMVMGLTYISAIIVAWFIGPWPKKWKIWIVFIVSSIFVTSNRIVQHSAGQTVIADCLPWKSLQWRIIDSPPSQLIYVSALRYNCSKKCRFIYIVKGQLQSRGRLRTDWLSQRTADTAYQIRSRVSAVRCGWQKLKKYYNSQGKLSAIGVPAECSLHILKTPSNWKQGAHFFV